MAMEIIFPNKREYLRTEQRNTYNRYNTMVNFNIYRELHTKVIISIVHFGLQYAIED